LAELAADSVQLEAFPVLFQTAFELSLLHTLALLVEQLTLFDER